MAMSTLDSAISVTGGQPRTLVKVDDDYAFLVKQTNMYYISTVGDVLGFDSANHACGSNVGGAFLVGENKICIIASDTLNTIISAMNVTVDGAGLIDTIGSVIAMRDLTGDPTQQSLSLPVCCAVGSTIQMFWAETHQDADPALDSQQYFTMSINASGTDPSAGSPVMYDEVLDVDTPYNPPRAAQLYGTLGGALIYGTGQEAYSPFSFGGSPTVPPTAITGGGDIGGSPVNCEIGCQLPGNIAFAGDVDGDVLLVNAAGVSNVASGVIANAGLPRMTPLQTRTALSTDGTDLQWLIFNSSDFSSVGETFSYGGGAPGLVVGMGVGLDRAVAIDFTGGSINGFFLIGDVPTSDPFPFVPEGDNRLWIYKSTDGGIEWVSRGVTT